MNKPFLLISFILITCISRAQHKSLESEASIKNIVHKVAESLENQNIQERIAIFSKDQPVSLLADLNLSVKF